MKRQQLLIMLALSATLAIPQLATAAVIISDLGNTTSGLSDGDKPTVPALATVQSGQPAPFDTGYGNDILDDSNFMQSWMHSYGPIVDSILSATITIGIADHDSAASGSQLALFTLDGNPFTAALDALFEAGGGSEDTEYNVYSLVLPGSLFADLADGTITAQLDLDEPGLVTPLFPLPGPNPAVDSTSNGAFLIFSTLEIETGVTPVPEPGTLSLMTTFGILLGAWSLRRRRRQIL